MGDAGFGEAGPVGIAGAGQLIVLSGPGPPGAQEGLEHVPQVGGVEGTHVVPGELPVQAVEVCTAGPLGLQQKGPALGRGAAVFGKGVVAAVGGKMAWTAA